MAEPCCPICRRGSRPGLVCKRNLEMKASVHRMRLAAMPLALILNELLANAVKHGIKDRLLDGVRVSLTNNDGRLALSVEDDGEGFDLEEIRKTASGLQLVLGLARQLQGTLSVSKNPSRACLDFPVARV